jgi:hypothetical protein
VQTTRRQPETSLWNAPIILVRSKWLALLFSAFTIHIEHIAALLSRGMTANARYCCNAVLAANPYAVVRMACCCKARDAYPPTFTGEMRRIRHPIQRWRAQGAHSETGGQQTQCCYGSSSVALLIQPWQASVVPALACHIGITLPLHYPTQIRPRSDPASVRPHE